MLWILTNWKLLLSGLLSAILSGVLFYYVGTWVGYDKGVEDTVISINAQASKQSKQRRADHAISKLDIIRLSDSDLDERLSRWVR
jgi:hypothetical protein